MSSFTISTLKRSLISSCSLPMIAAVVVAFSGCGSPSATVTPVGVSTQPANTHVPAIPPSGGTPNSDLSAIPSHSANALLGTYTGTLLKQMASGSVITQPYSVTLYAVTLQQGRAPYGALSFRSDGPLGDISFDSYLHIGLAGYPANGVTAYGFSTATPQSFPQLWEESFALHLILSLRSDGTFSSDPTHSAIFIKGCGFSQGSACSNFAQDVWFGADLRKQSP